MFFTSVINTFSAISTHVNSTLITSILVRGNITIKLLTSYINFDVITGGKILLIPFIDYQKDVNLKY